jgi:Gpi18-like mannosyltransferase
MQTDQTTVNISSVPGVSVTEEWRRFLTTWGKAALAVLPTFLLTRLALLLLTYFAVISFTVPANSTFALQPQTIFYSWYHWDATRFLSIVTLGYPQPEMAAYFPLYPVLVQLFNKTLHLDLLLSGMLVSNLAFLAALIVLYRFGMIEFDEETAKRSVLYLTVFPTALFTFAADAAPLFLLFLLLSFYLLRRAHWWLAGLCGALAALSDAAGILLFVVFVCEFVRQHDRTDLKARARAWLPLCAALLIPLGLVVYTSALQHQFGLPLAFLRFQDGSSRVSTPWSTLFALLANLGSGSFFTFAGVHSLFELLLLALFITLAILSFLGPVRLRADQWPFSLFTLLMLFYTVILPVLPGTTRSTLDPLPTIQLTTLVSFTALMVLARLGKRAAFHQSYLLFALPLYAFLVLQLLSNHWSI